MASVSGLFTRVSNFALGQPIFLNIKKLDSIKGTSLLRNHALKSDV
jgi:hypothetical protein